ADADRLDALGAIGIARTFAFGGAHGRPIWDPHPSCDCVREYGASSIHHFHEKLLKLPGDMYTEPGRGIAVRRVAFMQEFLSRFDLEWNGQDDDGAVEMALDGLLGSFPQRSVDISDRFPGIFGPILHPDPVD